MKYDIYAGDGITADGGITHIAVQELDSTVQRGEVGESPGAEIVDHAHGVAERDEPLSKVGTDKPGGTRNQAP